LQVAWKRSRKKKILKIEPGAMAVIARMAEGSLRDALSLLEQARAYCGDTIPDKEVRELLGVVPDDALEELIQAIAEGSADRALGWCTRSEGRPQPPALLPGDDSAHAQIC